VTAEILMTFLGGCEGEAAALGRIKGLRGEGWGSTSRMRMQYISVC
jgi:hypothetical protein